MTLSIDRPIVIGLTFIVLILAAGTTYTITLTTGVTDLAGNGR